MFKLEARNQDNSVKFEQVFEHYEAADKKERELREKGMTTLLTKLKEKDTTEYAESIIKKLVDSFGNSVLN